MPPFQSWLWAALKRRFLFLGGGPQGPGFLFLLLSLLCFLKFLIYPLDALGPRGGPYFLLLQKVGKDRRKGVSPPCESPDQSGVLDAPLWKPPSPRWRGKFSRTPRRLRGWSFGAVGEGRERVRARLGRRTSTASVLGASPPGPQGSQTGTFADHARTRMGQRPKRLAGNAPANLPEADRKSVV